MSNKGSDDLIPTDLSIESLHDTIQTTDDFYVLRGIVRHLRGGKGKSNGFFFSRIVVMFFSEAVEDKSLPFSKNDKIAFMQTFLDYVEMRIVVLIPDDSLTVEEKDSIRKKLNLEYTLGSEGIKNRGALTLMKTMKSSLKKAMAEEEKEEEKGTSEE